jgi:NAD+ synthase (glutamine-hydrolysing)
MVMSYSLAQLIPWSLGRRGFLLVLSASELDENLTGHFAKYSTTSGDLNPIGCMLKSHSREMIQWVAETYDYQSLLLVAKSTPSKETCPLGEGSVTVQTDEEEMGMTYDELFILTKLRKIQNCGPVSMFRCLVDMWENVPPREIATKVKHFFRMYSKNRHKQTVSCPVFQHEKYGVEDNRYDLR